MKKLAKDIVKGEKFQYITDYDFNGKPVKSMVIEASDNAMEYNGCVLIAFGGPEGLCYKGEINSIVEVINE